MTDNQSKYTLDLEGVISQRPRTREIPQDEGDVVLNGLQFEITTDRESRNDREGKPYMVDPRWTLSVFDFEDEKSHGLFTQVSDLQIGDRVTVTVAVAPGVRRGYPTINLRVLSLANQGPRR